jgi:hypothetical protein
MLVERAVAGRAEFIITSNVRHFGPASQFSVFSMSSKRCPSSTLQRIGTDCVTDEPEGLKKGSNPGSNPNVCG